MTATINIATIGEESFKYGTAVLLRSVAESCSADVLRFFILDLNLSRGTREKLTATVRQLARRAEVEFLDPQNSAAFREVMAIMKKRRRNFLHSCWFSKFAIPDLLAERADHVFFMDSDFFCALDLAEARALQGAYPACGAPDTPITDAGFSVEFEIEQLDGTAPYFNGGFMGLDLGWWKSHGLSKKAVMLTEKFTAFTNRSVLHLSEKAAATARLHGTFFNDQAVFNILFYKNWKVLPQDWNFQCPFGYGLFAEIAKGKKLNLHYVTNPKPWQVPVCNTTDFFYQTLDRTAFRGWRPNPLYWSAHLRLRRLKGWLAARLKKRNGP